MALILAPTAAALTFVPDIGPLAASIPAVLVALGEGGATALAVLALYPAIQAIESYLITPTIGQRTVDLPPVVTLVAQIAMASCSGFWAWRWPLWRSSRSWSSG